MKTKCFRKTFRVILEKFEDEYYLVNDMDIYKVNEVGARITELCNGKNTCEDIAGKLSSKYGVSKEEVYSDVTEFIDSMSRLGLLSESF